MKVFSHWLPFSQCELLALLEAARLSLKDDRTADALDLSDEYLQELAKVAEGVRQRLALRAREGQRVRAYLEERR